MEAEYPEVFCELLAGEAQQQWGPARAGAASALVASAVACAKGGALRRQRRLRTVPAEALPRRLGANPSAGESAGRLAPAPPLDLEEEDGRGRGQGGEAR